jgi:DNA-binding transcriptional LysR family regulator
LLVRAAGGMQLTRRGEALRYPVKDALEKVKDLLQCESFDPAVSARTFRIFVADNAADLLLPSLWAKLQHQAPKVRIEIQPWRGSGVAAHDLARSVDVAIGCMPGSFPGFYRQPLFTDRDACAARRGNPHLRGISRRARFLEAKHVAVIVYGMREDPVDTWLREEGCQRNVALTVPNYLQALHVVARSDLLAVIPERLIRAYARELKLRAKTVPLDVGTFEEYLLHPARILTVWPNCEFSIHRPRNARPLSVTNVSRAATAWAISSLRRKSSTSFSGEIVAAAERLDCFRSEIPRRCPGNKTSMCRHPVYTCGVPSGKRYHGTCAAGESAAAGVGRPLAGGHASFH